MTKFFEGLKSLFEAVPSKTQFLKDIGFNNSYIGFRYFLQGHNDEPSVKFMKKMCNELGYEYILLPISPEKEHQEIKNKLQSEFSEDLKKYLKQYEGSPKRTFTKRDDSVSLAVAAFDVEKELLDPKKQIDVSDLF